MKKTIPTCIALILVLAIPVTTAYSYNLEIDKKSYKVDFEGNAEVIAMAIDKETISLLIGIKNAEDSSVKVMFPNELINAEDNKFAVLVDGYEVDYNISSNELTTTISFFVPYGSQEIEIIGTHVVPEFTALFVILAAISLVVLISKLSFKDYLLRW